jgi:hypothetical protein
MKTVAVYSRNGAVFVLPNVGMADAEPVFTARMDVAEVVAALDGALAALPSAVSTVSMEYRSPLMTALKIKSGAAFERGLKSAKLWSDDNKWSFFRFVPHPMFKTGLRREDDPVFTLPVNAPLVAVAEKVVAALDDPSWPVRTPRAKSARVAKKGT